MAKSSSSVGSEDTVLLELTTKAETPAEFLEESLEVVNQFNDRVVQIDQQDPLVRHERELLRQFLLWVYHGAPSPE